MPTQFTPAADSALNFLEKMLGDETICPGCSRPRGIVPAQTFLTKRFDETFVAVFSEFDNNGLKDKPARFIASDGYTLARQITDPDERLAEDVLLANLTEVLPAAEADKLWRSVTDVHTSRTVNQNKLAKAIKSGKIQPDWVTSAMQKPKPVTSRHRRKATKEDMAFVSGQGAQALDATIKEVTAKTA